MFTNCRFSILLLAVGIEIISCKPALWDSDNDWASWKKQHGRGYNDDAEHGKRYAIFKTNKDAVTAHNAKPGLSFKMSLNHLSDMTDEELSKMQGAKLPANWKPKTAASSTRTVVIKTRAAAGDSLDWRTKGAISAVKEQGKCGSCWAMAVSGALEGHLQIKAGGDWLIPLSPQNLVDCSPNEKYFTNGCSGGWPVGAMMWVNDVGGINMDSAYPYTSQGGTATGSCKFNNSTYARYAPLTPPGYVYIEPNDEQGLVQALKTGPVVVTMWSSVQSFYGYGSGVYADPACPTDKVNHAVLLIGYGTDAASGKPYWLIKNSWGAGWGEKGFFRLARGGNTCSILLYGGAYPLVKYVETPLLK